MEHLLSIGAFSRRCGMSISALRFYGECGLIIPRAVDESTGYRYYGEDQLEEAQLVRHLRGAELPVESVRRFLSADDEGRRRALDAHGAELAARAGALQRSLDEARRLLGPPPAGEAERCCVVDARALAAAFGQVSFAAARGDARRELRGVALEVREDAVRLVATDSYRLVIRDLALAVDVPGRPLRAVLELAEMERFLGAGEAGSGGAATLLAGSRGELIVELGEKRTVLGSIGGDFPDYEALLAALPAGSNGVVARQTLRDSLARAGGTATLHFDARGLSVAARGEVRRLPGTWPGPPRQVLVNSDYLAEALEHLAGPDVVIEVGEPLQPVVLRSADTGTCTIWTMPIRPEP